MSIHTRSVLSASGKPDVAGMTTDERLQYGAENAVRCMGINSQDRVFIIAYYERERIARLVGMAALDRYAEVPVRFLEHYGERPLTSFPDDLRLDLLQAH